MISIFLPPLIVWKPGKQGASSPGQPLTYARFNWFAQPERQGSFQLCSIQVCLGADK